MEFTYQLDFLIDEVKAAVISFCGIWVVIEWDNPCKVADVGTLLRSLQFSF